MAVPATRTVPITAEELAHMGDVGRCELIDGRIVPMAPTGDEHGGIEGNIFAALKAYADAHRTGRVRVGEVGIVTRRSPDRVRGADVLFISEERYARRDRDKAFLDVAPEIVVEVLSPEDRARDVMEKIREYLDAGVTEVWVADSKTRTVAIHRGASANATVRVLADVDVLMATDLLPGFELPVGAIFEI